MVIQWLKVFILFRKWILEAKDYLYSVKTVLLPPCCCWTSLFASYIHVNHFHYYQFFMVFMTFKMLNAPARILLGIKWNLYGYYLCCCAALNSYVGMVMVRASNIWYIQSLLVWFMCSNKCRPFMQFAYSEVVFILYIHFPLIQPCLIGIQVKQKSPRFIYIYDITLLIC
jgi:hypothetical protein